MVNSRTLAYLLCLTVWLAVGCNMKTDTPEKAEADLSQPPGTPQPGQANAGNPEAEVRTVITETIRLLEEEKFREWVEKFAPARERTPERLAKVEEQIREEAHKVQTVLAAFRQAQAQSPQFSSNGNEARFEVKSSSGYPGEIVLARESDRWIIKKMNLDNPRGPRGPARVPSKTVGLKQIGLALHNYHEAHNRLPTDIRSPEGTPLLSWRVELLPYLEQAALYNQFKKDEPWDSPHNKPLLANLAVFGGVNTPFVAPLVERSLLGGKTPVGFRDVTDGLSNTAMVVESGSNAKVPWSKPQDIAIDPKQPLSSLKLESGQSLLVLLGDGRVMELPSNADPAAYLALFDRADGRTLVISPERLEVKDPANPNDETRLKSP